MRELESVLTVGWVILAPRSFCERGPNCHGRRYAAASRARGPLYRGCGAGGVNFYRWAEPVKTGVQRERNFTPRDVLDAG